MRSAKARSQVRDGDADSSVDTLKDGTRPAGGDRDVAAASAAPPPLRAPAPPPSPPTTIGGTAARAPDRLERRSSAVFCHLQRGPLPLTVPACAALLVWVAVLFLPGAAVAGAAGLRPWTVAATAPLLTYGLATAAGTLATVVDLTWGPWTLAAAAATAGGLVLLLRAPSRATGRLPAPRRSSASGRGRPGAGRRGGARAGCISMSVLLTGFGSTDRANQAWDVQLPRQRHAFIADTGQVAPVGAARGERLGVPVVLLPNAYHALAAVVRDVTGSSVFEVLNTHTLLICGLAGLGLVALLRELGAPTVVAAATPVLLACFAAFPYDLVSRGPQLPYAMGLALVPAFLCLALRTIRTPRPSSIAATALGGAALFGVHPSAALAAGLFTVVLVIAGWVARRGVDVVGLAALVVTGVGTAVLAAPMVLGSLQTGTGGPEVDWAAVDQPLAAALQAATLDEARRGPQLCLAALTLVGLLSLRSARYLWWLLAATAVPLVLYVLAASSDSALTAALTRPWWNDRWRFSAWAVLGLAPLAAHGAWRSAVLLRSAGERLQPTAGTRSLRRVVAVSGALALTALAFLYAAGNAPQWPPHTSPTGTSTPPRPPR